jgi:hypothetical protein
LKQSDKLIGTIQSASLFKRKALVNLPEAIPIHIKSFMFWLVIITWKRQIKWWKLTLNNIYS